MTRERELYLLMECAESPFGLGRVEDHEWHVANDPTSTSAWIAVLAKEGYLSIQSMGRFANAEITPAGRKRLNELAAAGVEPENVSL